MTKDQLEEVDHFSYLGSVLANDGDADHITNEEVLRRTSTRPLADIVGGTRAAQKELSLSK